MKKRESELYRKKATGKENIPSKKTDSKSKKASTPKKGKVSLLGKKRKKETEIKESQKKRSAKERDIFVMELASPPIVQPCLDPQESHSELPVNPTPSNAPADAPPSSYQETLSSDTQLNTAPQSNSDPKNTPHSSSTPPISSPQPPSDQSRTAHPTPSTSGSDLSISYGNPRARNNYKVCVSHSKLLYSN